MTEAAMRRAAFHGLVTRGEGAGDRVMRALDKDNPWVRDVFAAPRRMPAWIALPGASIFAVSVLMLFKFNAGLLEGALGAVWAPTPAPWADILTFGVLQGLIFGSFLAAAVAATAFEGRRAWRGGADPLSALAIGLACGAAGFCAAVAIAFLAGGVAAGTATGAPVGALAVGAALVAFQSLAEEAFFRGWLQPVLCAGWGLWPGLLLTSGVFAALHIVADAHGGLAVVNLFLGGVLFGLLALRTGGLLAPVAAHFAWNWSESGVLGLNTDPSGSVLMLRFAGARLWNGGADTMNGSLATTLVLSVLVTGFLLAGPAGAIDATAGT